MTSPTEPDLRAQRAAEQEAQWNRNKPSLLVDMGLALLFFALAKITDNLPLSAIITAVAGLAVVVVQRFVKVDLLGGLAMFGVVMLLISAAFSYWFNDDWAVKMKSTILGVLVASLMLSDGFFNRGRYFGIRLGRYMPYPVVPKRFAIGMGVLGLVMAAANWLVAKLFSKDIWLYYTTFGDIILTMALVLVVLAYAKRKPGESENTVA